MNNLTLSTLEDQLRTAAKRRQFNEYANRVRKRIQAGHIVWDRTEAMKRQAHWAWKDNEWETVEPLKDVEVVDVTDRIPKQLPE